jgi:hypothetical protein
MLFTRYDDKYLFMPLYTVTHPFYASGEKAVVIMSKAYDDSVPAYQ